jgi:signal transduction histidine kinase
MSSAPKLNPGPSEMTALSRLTHDLRAQILVAEGHTELIHDDAEDDSRQRWRARKVLKACERMKQLVDRCLESASGRRARSEEVDLDRLVEECVSLHALQARRKAIELDAVRHTKLPATVTDVVALRRVMDNLIINAIKYSRPGSTVTVGAASNGDTVRLSVSDQGPGIPKREIDALFADYRLGSAKPTAGEARFGLGLAVVQQLVADLGGHVEVQSRVGHGSTFTVVLPH